MKNLTVREFAFFSLVATFDESFFWLTKKGGQRNIIYELKKLISLVYDVNYYLIISIDREPQRLYSQCYSYRWHNSNHYMSKIKGCPKIRVKGKRTNSTWNMKYKFMAKYCHSCTFL